MNNNTYYLRALPLQFAGSDHPKIEDSPHKAVKPYPACFGKLNPEFVDEAISELAISDNFRDLAETASERAIEILGAVHAG